jgi:asparagine synthase (glutamine-hydrolysing)
MSGIAGIIHFDGAPIEPGLIEKMTAAMHDRGPDGIRHWQNGSVALGQCMLRTTPESLEEIQPWCNEDQSLAMVMDGRVDNWLALRKDLLNRGCRLRNNSDVELVLRAYQLWGMNCPQHIDGDFVFAVWNDNLKNLFMARDRVGIKPIYYWKYGNSLSFATDMHAILALPGSPKVMNEKMVAEHLLVTVDNLTETLVQGINRLKPASAMAVSSDTIKITQYWDIDFRKTISYKDENDYASHLAELLDDAVKKMMRSNGDIGFYLSGGIDSSSILCTGIKNSRANKNIQSFSLVFPGQGCDESHYISLVNQYCGLDGNILAGLPSPLAHHIASIGKYKDVCDAPNSSMLNAIRSKAHEKGIRVMLTGYGGDEWFGKNPFYMADLIKSKRLGLLLSEFSFLRKNGRTIGQIRSEISGYGIRPLAPEALKRPIRSLRKSFGNQSNSQPSLYTKIMTQEFSGKHKPAIDMSSEILIQNTATLSQKYLYRLLKLGWNVRGLEIDNRVTSSYEIEERSPFYDARIIEFAIAIPDHIKSKSGGKHVLRKAMKGYAPDEILQRQDKAEFSGVLVETLMNPEIIKLLTKGNLVQNGWVDQIQLNHIYELFNSANNSAEGEQGRNIWPLWMAFSLELSYIQIMHRTET